MVRGNGGKAQTAGRPSAIQVGLKVPPESTIRNRRFAMLADHKSLPNMPVRLLTPLIASVDAVKVPHRSEFIPAGG